MMKKVSSVFNCLALILLLGVTQGVVGILRNLITDRCIQIDKGASPDVEAVVSAVPCTLREPTAKTGDHNGYNLEWLQVVPTSKDDPKAIEHTIQAHFSDNLVCIQTREEVVTTGDCKSSDSILLINKVLQKNNRGPSYERMFPGPIFTIEQPHTNKCLSVVPGTTELQLTNCSQSNGFQRWIACRNLGACDVEISWSPARIIFPKSQNRQDDFKTTSPTKIQTSRPPLSMVPAKTMQKLIQIQESRIQPSFETQTSTAASTTQIAIATSSSVQNCPKIFVNELLYFVHNAQIMNLEDKKIVTIISDFYSRKLQGDALDLLKTNFVIDVEPRSESTPKGIQIVHWMKQLTKHGMNSDVIFASKRLSGLPPIFTDNNTPEIQGRPNRENLEKLKDRIETSLNLIMEKLKDFKSEVVSDLGSILAKTSSYSSSEGSNTFDPASDDTDMIDNIDLRKGQSNNSRRRYKK